MHCHAAAQQTLVILSPTLPKLCDMNSHFICLSLRHFSCIYQRGSSSTAFSTSARQRLARMSRGVHFSTWSQQAHGSLQPTVQNCISRFITHMRWHHPCFRRALFFFCRATLLVGCVGSRRQANQRWLPLASPVPTKPIKENDIKKPKHAYPWEDQCTHLAAVWVRSCTIVSQDAAVFCLNFLRVQYCTVGAWLLKKEDLDIWAYTPYGTAWTCPGPAALGRCEYRSDPRIILTLYQYEDI